ncbi:MAG: alpha/beta fold hydrolase [Cyclobacteriaceae bacterium]
MPIIKRSAYKAPIYYRNGHISTIVPSLLKNAKNPGYDRERLELDDGDFLDVDWLKPDDSDKVVIISHGLEGSSERYYVIQCAKYFAKAGWNVMAWNYRSCSGEMNRNLRLYHHGVTDDLGAIVDQAKRSYPQVYMICYSMGGSTTLKYLGEQSENTPSEVKKAAVFSVPCNLWNSAERLKLQSNGLYKKRFLKKLKAKIVAKAQQYPDKVDILAIKELDTFEEFDARYTAQLNGFKDAADFYETTTCDQFIPAIKTPTLIVNALNKSLHLVSLIFCL